MLSSKTSHATTSKSATQPETRQNLVAAFGPTQSTNLRTLMPATEFTTSLGLPFDLGKVSGTWVPDNAERDAAWEMYVELITRVTVADLGANEGLLREALTSFYSLFETTRGILKKHGPTIAQPTAQSNVSFAHLAVAILNNALRPLLASWHPLLDDYESERPETTSRLEWERSWERHEDLRSAITEVRTTLIAYAGLLGEVCGAKNLLVVATNPEQPGPRAN